MPVTCREYTLPRYEKSTDQNGWIRGNTKIGPVLEVTTCCLQGKYGVEIRIESMNKDHSHSWVRIPHGSSKLVTNLEQQGAGRHRAGNLRNAIRKLCVKIEWHVLFESRSKATCETTKTFFCQLIHQNYTYWGKELGPILNHKIIRSPIAQCRSQPREDDGAIEFLRIKDYLQTILCILDNGLMKSRRASWQEEEETRKYFSIVLEILYLRALQGHSGRNLIDPTLQDNVIILDVFFQYIYHVGCAINLHSIINSGLIPGGQILSKSMDKEHKDPEKIDLEAPRLARYMHTAWKKHQNTVYWVDIKLALKK